MHRTITHLPGPGVFQRQSSKYSMVILTADDVREAVGFLNANKQRELDLRDRMIHRLDNLGVTSDQFDVIDLSGNLLTSLENFPILFRLNCVLAHNNSIKTIDRASMMRLKNLDSLTLTNNNIASVEEVKHLGSIRSLRHLSLVGNPITASATYRKEVIAALPFLSTLDHKKILQGERETGLGAQERGTADTVLHEVGADPSSTPCADVRPNIDSTSSTVDPQLLNHAFSIATTVEAMNRIEEALRKGTFNADFVSSLSVKKNAEDSMTAQAEPTSRKRKHAEAVPSACETVPRSDAPITEANTLEKHNKVIPATNFSMKDLMKRKKGELQELCKGAGIDSTGTKAELSKRLIHSS